MGTNPSDFLGYNPFTASVEVKLHSAYANSDSITKISNAIRHNSNVKDVLYQQGLLDAVNSNIRNISAVLLGLAFLLTLISFALINNTIRQSIHSKRFLIHTMDCHCSVIFILTVQKVVIDRILNTILHQQIICRLIAPVSFISEG